MQVWQWSLHKIFTCTRGFQQFSIFSNVHTRKIQVILQNRLKDIHRDQNISKSKNLKILTILKLVKVKGNSLSQNSAWSYEEEVVTGLNRFFFFFFVLILFEVEREIPFPRIPRGHMKKKS